MCVYAMCCSPGLDRWFLLTAASKHDDVQGEVLVEIVLTDQGAGVVGESRGGWV